MRRLLLFVCVVLLVCVVRLRAADTENSAGTSGPDAPTGSAAPATAPAIPHDLALAVAQLGDDDPRVRDSATRKLGGMGRAALPALREAAQGDDPEVASRARRLLTEFRYGIDPDTPAPLMQLVNQYRSDQGDSRQQAINALAAMGWSGYRVLARLRCQETDANWRTALSAPLRSGAATVVSAARDMIAAGKEDDAQARLADAAAGGDGLVARSYVALVLARGRLDDALGELRAEAGDTPGADDALLLALMYRAKGDADNALKCARQVAPAAPGVPSQAEELVKEVLLDRHDWAPLIADANRHANDAANPMLRRAALAEKLSYARLAGDAKSVDEALAAIREAVEQNPEFAPAYAAALVLNDRSPDAIDMLAKAKGFFGPVSPVVAAYHLMVSQGRYEDAAKLVANAQTDAPADLPLLELTSARRLTWLGDKDAASAIIDHYEKEIEPASANPAQGDLIESEVALGRTDKAFERAVAAMGASAAAPNNGNSVNQILNHIAPNNVPQALAWRGYLADQHPRATPAEVLHKLWALYARKLPAAEAESILHDAADNAVGQNPADRVAIYQRVTETARTIGRDDLAETFLQKWAADPVGIAGGWFPWKSLGDRAMARKDYPRAVDCYDKAVQRSAGQVPLCLWLHGWSTTQAAAGDPDKLEKAKAEMRRADEYLLGDDSQWLTFLQGIAEAGADSTGDAERQRDLMRRIGAPGSWEINESYRLTARSLLPPSDSADEMEVPDTTDSPQRAGPRYLRSADLLSRWMLRIAQGESAFIMPEAYLMQPSIIHSLRARGLIATGDVPGAMKEADLSLSMLPANSQLPIDLVPALDRHGHKPEGDAIFRKVAAKVDSEIARHRQCAELHNGFAWMCAKCDRDLDKALANAQQATRLMPDSVAFLDTLAEVHFHRGDRQAAIDTMKHCIELDPHFEYLRHQLKRFTTEVPATQP
jgi:tetratricopeptide (TPR) repeat protein